MIPPLVNTFIGFFKDTSLVLIIGIFDLLLAGKVAITDPVWQAYSTELYIVLAVIYFAFCFVMARYSRGLEQEFSRAARRCNVPSYRIDIKEPTMSQAASIERPRTGRHQQPRRSCSTRSTSGTARCTCCATSP